MGFNIDDPSDYFSNTPAREILAKGHKETLRGKSSSLAKTQAALTWGDQSVPCLRRRQASHRIGESSIKKLFMSYVKQWQHECLQL